MSRLPRAAALALAAVAATAAYLALAAALYFGYTTRIGAAVDLFLPWWALRQALAGGVTPYGAAMGLAARAARFGGDPPPLPLHPYRFAYPLYFGFFIAPLLPLSYPWAAAAWMAALTLASGAAALLLCRLLDWPRSPPGRILATLAGALSYPALISVVLGQITPLVLVALLGGLLAYRARRDALAGALLALTTVKPQLVWLALPLLLADSLRAGRRRVCAAFGAALALLCLLPALWLPGWPLQFAASLPGYTGDEPTPSAALLAIQLLSGAAGWGLARQEMDGLWHGWPAALAGASGTLAVLMVVRWWWRRRPGPLHVLSVALAVTLLVTPVRAQTTQLGLVVPLWWALRSLGTPRRALAILVAAALLGGWWGLVLSRSDPPWFLLRQLVPPLVALPLALLPAPPARQTGRGALQYSGATQLVAEGSA